MSYIIKQVIVMRKDLKMRRGKEMAQAAHASMAFLSRRIQWLLDDTLISLTSIQEEWLKTSFAKVALYCESLEELQEIENKAKDAGLEVHVITDSGKTEFHGQPTMTCLAIGPDLAEKIDPITKHLKLA